MCVHGKEETETITGTPYTMYYGFGREINHRRHQVGWERENQRDKNSWRRLPSRDKTKINQIILIVSDADADADDATSLVVFFLTGGGQQSTSLLLYIQYSRPRRVSMIYHV